MNFFLALGLTYAFLLHEASTFLYSAQVPSCDQLHEYNAVISALYGDPCISDTQLWKMLEPLRAKSRICLSDLIIKVAGYVDTHHEAGRQCKCTHDFNKVAYTPLGFNQDHLAECVTFNPGCEYLFNYFFLLPLRQPGSKCLPHYHVWTHLRDIHNRLGVDSQGEMVLHLSHSYWKGYENACQCHLATPHLPHLPLAPTPKSTTQSQPVNSSHLPKAPTKPANTSPTPEYTTKDTPVITTVHGAHSTGLVPTHPPTSTIVTPTTTFPASTTCRRFSVLGAIAEAKLTNHPSAYLCPSGNKTSSEALLLEHCNIGTPVTWKEGINVMKHCAQIPEYTPVATFGTRYLGLHEHEGISGIFMGCITGGFKMAYQDCGTHATIRHVEIGVGTGKDDPDNYFVIVQ